MFQSIPSSKMPQIKAQALADEPGFVVSIALAEELETGRIAFLETMFRPATVDGDDFSELTFEISIISLDDTFEAFSTQMRDLVRQYLPLECVSKILGLVDRSCQALVEFTRPRRIYYVTKERDLPAKALIKYERITKYIEDSGYVLSEHDVDAAGRQFWKLVALDKS